MFESKKIAENEIGNGGVKFIGEKLKDCKWVHTLNLSGNKITDEGSNTIGYHIDLLKDELKPNCLFLCNLLANKSR